MPKFTRRPRRPEHAVDRVPSPFRCHCGAEIQVSRGDFNRALYGEEGKAPIVCPNGHAVALRRG